MLIGALLAACSSPSDLEDPGRADDTPGNDVARCNELRVPYLDLFGVQDGDELAAQAASWRACFIEANTSRIARADQVLEPSTTYVSRAAKYRGQTLCAIVVEASRSLQPFPPDPNDLAKTALYCDGSSEELLAMLLDAHLPVDGVPRVPRDGPLDTGAPLFDHFGDWEDTFAPCYDEHSAPSSVRDLARCVQDALEQDLGTEIGDLVAVAREDLGQNPDRDDLIDQARDLIGDKLDAGNQLCKAFAAHASKLDGKDAARVEHECRLDVGELVAELLTEIFD